MTLGEWKERVNWEPVFHIGYTGFKPEAILAAIDSFAAKAALVEMGLAKFDAHEQIFFEVMKAEIE